MLERILVALDGSDHANKALDWACDLAGRYQSELIAVHVVSDRPLSEAERQMAEVEFHLEMSKDYDVTPLLDARGDPRLTGELLAAQAAETGRRFRQAWGERLLEDARFKAKDRKVRKFEKALMQGGPARSILKIAEDKKVDLIVMGRRGLGDLAGLMLGSISHKVSELANCACLTVK